MDNNLSQSNVSDDPKINEALSSKERFANIEGDVVAQRTVLSRLVTQNDKYTEYLDREIKAKRESYEFWRDVKRKLAVSGIWGMVVIVFSVIAYAAKQWIANH